jgi:putative oxidoreductase
MARAKVGLAWLLQVLFGVLFVVIGIAKFGDPSWARKFEGWGYPDGFYMVIGVVEALAGLALLVPRIAFHAALTLAAIMVGAALTHLRFGETSRLSGLLLFLSILAVVAWLRKPAARRHGAMAASPPPA